MAFNPQWAGPGFLITPRGSQQLFCLPDGPSTRDGIKLSMHRVIRVAVINGLRVIQRVEQAHRWNLPCLERITSRSVDMFLPIRLGPLYFYTLPILLPFGPADALVPRRFLFQAPVSRFLMSMAMEIFVRLRPAMAVIVMGVGKVRVFRRRQG